MSLNEGLSPRMIRLLSKYRPDVLLLPGVVSQRVLVREMEFSPEFEFFWPGYPWPQDTLILDMWVNGCSIYVPRDSWALRDLYEPE